MSFADFRGPVVSARRFQEFSTSDEESKLALTEPGYGLLTIWQKITHHAVMILAQEVFTPKTGEINKVVTSPRWVAVSYIRLGIERRFRRARHTAIRNEPIT